MKIFSIIALALFINFLSLPTVALVMDWEIAMVSTQNMSEEENQQNFSEEEKQHTAHQYAIPQLLVAELVSKAMFTHNDQFVAEHYLQIFSPPPEIA